MPHIHTGPGNVDAVATAYVFIQENDQYKVLLHRHKKLDMLLPPGGHVELDETPWAAMYHELKEETGYDLEELQVLQPKERITDIDEIVVHPYPVFMNTHEIPGNIEHYHSDTSYLFLAKSKPQAVPLEDETQELLWYSRDEVENLSSKDMWRNTQQILLEIFDTFVDAWEAVPADSFSLKKRASRDFGGKNYDKSA